MALPLSVDVVASGFSKALNRLVIASTRPSNAVNLIDPDGGPSEAIPLPAQPRQLVVRDDEVVAAVVHDGGLTFIDLARRAVMWSGAQLPTHISFGADPRVMFDDDMNRRYWFDLQRGTSAPPGIQPGFGYNAVFAVAPTSTTTVYLAADKLYRVDNDGATAAATYDLKVLDPGADSPGGICSREIHILAGGQYLMAGCARIFKLAPDGAADLRYQGSLDRFLRTDDTIYSTRLGAFVSVQGSLGLVSSDSSLVVHDAHALGLTRRVGWKHTDMKGRAKALYEGASGRLYILGWDDSLQMDVPTTFVVGTNL